MEKEGKYAFWEEEGEKVIAYNFKTEKEARQAIHKMEKEECGIDDDELFSGELVEVEMVKIVGVDGDYYSYDKKDTALFPKEVKIGFVGSI